MISVIFKVISLNSTVISVHFKVISVISVNFKVISCNNNVISVYFR